MNIDKKFSPKNSWKIMKSYCRYRKLVIRKKNIFFHCLLYSPYRTLCTLSKDKVVSFEDIFFKHTAIKRFHLRLKKPDESFKRWCIRPRKRQGRAWKPYVPKMNGRNIKCKWHFHRTLGASSFREKPFKKDSSADVGWEKLWKLYDLHDVQSTRNIDIS